jgi:hypothetical protein
MKCLLFEKQKCKLTDQPCQHPVELKYEKTCPTYKHHFRPWLLKKADETFVDVMELWKEGWECKTDKQVLNYIEDCIDDFKEWVESDLVANNGLEYTSTYSLLNDDDDEEISKIIQTKVKDLRRNDDRSRTKKTRLQED